MSGSVHISRSRSSDLDLMARCMDAAAWCFLNGEPSTDHPHAKADPTEKGPAEFGFFEETVLGLKIDGTVGDSPLRLLPHPFGSAFSSMHLVVVLHIDRIRFVMIPAHVRHAAVEMSFQMREDREDLPETVTMADLSALATRIASMLRDSVPEGSPVARAALDEMHERAMIYSILGFADTGAAVSVALISGDRGSDDVVLADGPEGQVHFAPALRVAVTGDAPVVRSVSVDPDGVLQMFRDGESMGWDGLLRGHVSRRHAETVEEFVPDPMDAMRTVSDWEAHRPFTVTPDETEEGEDRCR